MQIGEAVAARLVSGTDAGDAAAQNNLGVVLQRAGRLSDARAAFDRAVALDGGMTVARWNLRALAPDATASAAARWTRVRTDATDADAWRALVRHHTGRGEFDAAADALARWECAAGTNVAASTERARWALDAGRPDEALVAVTRARAGAGAHARIGDVALFAMLDLLEARAAYQSGDALRALGALERARAATPDDAEAELLLSFVLGEIGANDAAVASRARATTLDPSLARVDAGIVALGSDGGTDAPRDAEIAPPARARGVLAMVTALSHKGYYAEALDALAAATLAADDVERAARSTATGVVHLLRGAATDAIAPLTDALHAVERSGGVLDDVALRLAVAELLAGAVADSDARARPIAYGAGGPLAIAGAMTVRAVAAWRTGDHATARTYLLDAASRARSLDDVVRAALAANLALLLAEMGAGAAAAAAGAAAARLAPAHAGVHSAYGRALAQGGDHAGARAAFGRACALAPADPAACYGLAFAAGACGDLATARVELARATALSPVVRGPTPFLVFEHHGPVVLPADGAGVRVGPSPQSGRSVSVAACTSMSRPAHDYAHVDARLAAGEYDRALAAAEAALARGAPIVEGLTRAGHALIGSGREREALERYRQAAAAAPANAAPELHVVRTLHRIGQFGDACARAHLAAARWPDNPAFPALLARASADRGAIDDALAALERCARAPRHAVAAADPAAFWSDVACAWEALGAWDAAADAWTEASRAVPALPSPALARARALARAGRIGAADALLQQLADQSPDLPDIWRARAELAMAAGEFPAARAHLARVVGRDEGDVDALAGLAAACADAARFDDARAAAGQVLAVDPDHPVALAVDGDCAAAAGDRTAARAAWLGALAASPVGVGAARARKGLGRAQPERVCDRATEIHPQ